MTDVTNIGPAAVAQVMRASAGRSPGSATPRQSPAAAQGQTLTRQELHALAEEVQREPLKAVEPKPKNNTQAVAQRDEHLQAAMDKFNRSVNFRIDRETGINVITIRDRATHEVIRQFPPEEFLTLVSRMEEMRGLFFEEVA